MATCKCFWLDLQRKFARRHHHPGLEPNADHFILGAPIGLISCAYFGNSRAFGFELRRPIQIKVTKLTA